MCIVWLLNKLFIFVVKYSKLHYQKMNQQNNYKKIEAVLEQSLYKINKYIAI